jgi:hypothetical protein
MQTTRGMCSLLAPSSLSVLRWPNPVVLLYPSTSQCRWSHWPVVRPSVAQKLGWYPAACLSSRHMKGGRVWVSDLHRSRSGSSEFRTQASSTKLARHRNRAYCSSQLWGYDPRYPQDKTRAAPSEVASPQDQGVRRMTLSACTARLDVIY